MTKNLTPNPSPSPKGRRYAKVRRGETLMQLCHASNNL
ncbi:hypothetical protein NSP_12630 [Nodularia spumigena CCY9414]|nr:hypothetical protein NSP_12630 [Nodularia spumigena CCY9414]